MGVCSKAPYSRLQFPLRGHRRAAPVEDLQLELRVFSKQRDDFDDVVHGYLLSRPFGLGRRARFLEVTRRFGFDWGFRRFAGRGLRSASFRFRVTARSMTLANCRR